MHALTVSAPLAKETAGGTPKLVQPNDIHWGSLESTLVRQRDNQTTLLVKIPANSGPICFSSQQPTVARHYLALEQLVRAASPLDCALLQPFFLL
jgi:hypothetical protein